MQALAVAAQVIMVLTFCFPSLSVEVFLDQATFALIIFVHFSSVALLLIALATFVVYIAA